MKEETICAIATAMGEGSIGIIRISGEAALGIGDALFRSPRGVLISQLPSFHAAYGHIQDSFGETVDECLVMPMRGPKTYTCEDVLEIHCHGSLASLQRILSLVVAHGARLAEPGEFTKRAFLNGRIDLAQAEAVMEIIRARTDLSLKAAVSQLRGSLSQPIRQLREELVAMIAQLEAAIDFPEEDIEDLAVAEVGRRVADSIRRLTSLTESARFGRLLREGVHTVIAGRPNVGKSSLLNALLREARAIVTDIPGTTRDIIEEQVHIKGIPLRIVDTAGIRDTADVVEKLGVERSCQQLADADLVLVMLDASAPLSSADRQILALVNDKPALVILNKSDLPVQLTMAEIGALLPGKEILQASAVTGTGLEELEEKLYTMITSGAVEREGAFIASARQAEQLRAAAAALQAAREACEAYMPPDMVVIDLRQAWHSLGEVIGEAMTDDLLSQIFSRFCIGK